MRARTTDTTDPAPRYGLPSPALLDRADRGYARFLAQQTETKSTTAARPCPPPLHTPRPPRRGIDEQQTPGPA